MILDEKNINFFLLYCLVSFIQISQIPSLIYSSLIPTGKLCSMICPQMGYFNPFRETDNSFILFLFLYFYIVLIECYTILRYAYLLHHFTDRRMVVAHVPMNHTCSFMCIYLSLFDSVYDLVDGRCAQNDWHLGSKVSWIWNDQGH